MPTYYKGVNIVEGDSPSLISGLSQTVTLLLGTFEKGELNKPIRITTLADAQRKLGSHALTGITSYYDLQLFFAEAGEAPVDVVNIKGSSAAKASKTIQDIDGTPENTLKIEASSEGAWGNNLTVEVLDYNILTTTLGTQVDPAAESATLVSTTGLEIGSFIEFDNGTNQEKVVLTSVNHQTGVVVWSGGLTNTYTVALTTVKSQEFEIVVYENAVEVERWQGLSMNDDVSFFCEKLVVNSNYITVTDLDSATTPAYNTMPAATTSAQALTGGDDDLTGLQLADWQGVAADATGIYAAEGSSELFRIACPNPKMNTDPDASYVTLVQSLLSYARSRKGIEVYAEVPYGSTDAEAVTFADKYEGRELAIFDKWIKTTQNGQTVWLSPVGAVLGRRARLDRERGIYKNIGGERLTSGLDISRYSTRENEETLNDAGVNTIILDQGLRIWGGRTQSALVKWRFINHSEQFNEIAQTLLSEARGMAFEPITAVTTSRLARIVTAYLNRKVAEGGLIGFIVNCGFGTGTNNPPEETALGHLHCGITLDMAGVAEKIIFTIDKTSVGITMTEAA